MTNATYYTTAWQTNTAWTNTTATQTTAYADPWANMTAAIGQLQRSYKKSAYKAAGALQAVAVKPVPPPKPKFTDRIASAFARLAEPAEPKVVSDRAAALKELEKRGMPLIAGAAPEAEIKKTVEEIDEWPRRKIILERTVPVKRLKSGRTQETHSGKVTLVKTVEGPDHLTNSVGIKVEGHGTNHVEIPIKDLREALDDLEKKPKKRGK